jgi:hypothetical protein
MTKINDPTLKRVINDLIVNEFSTHEMCRKYKITENAVKKIELDLDVNKETDDPVRRANMFRVMGKKQTNVILQLLNNKRTRKRSGEKIRQIRKEVEQEIENFTTIKANEQDYQPSVFKELEQQHKDQIREYEKEIDLNHTMILELEEKYDEILLAYQSVEKAVEEKHQELNEVASSLQSRREALQEVTNSLKKTTKERERAELSDRQQSEARRAAELLTREARRRSMEKLRAEKDTLEEDITTLRSDALLWSEQANSSLTDSQKRVAEAMKREKNLLKKLAQLERAEIVAQEKLEHLAGRTQALEEKKSAEAMNQLEQINRTKEQSELVKQRISEEIRKIQTEKERRLNDLERAELVIKQRQEEANQEYESTVEQLNKIREERIQEEERLRQIAHEMESISSEALKPLEYYFENKIILPLSRYDEKLFRNYEIFELSKICDRDNMISFCANKGLTPKNKTYNGLLKFLKQSFSDG